MPKFTIKGNEQWDPEKEEFLEEVLAVVDLEHSLVSLSKWESKWEVPFFSEKSKTSEQTLDYIVMMCSDDSIDPDAFLNMGKESIEQITEYIESKQTATWFSESKDQKVSTEVITAELIYYWMVTLNIPFECQHWHINRLLTLVKVCNEKNQPAKKRSRKEVMERNRELNAKRRAEANSPG